MGPHHRRARRPGQGCLIGMPGQGAARALPSRSARAGVAQRQAPPSTNRDEWINDGDRGGRPTSGGAVSPDRGRYDKRQRLFTREHRADRTARDAVCHTRSSNTPEILCEGVAQNRGVGGHPNGLLAFHGPSPSDAVHASRRARRTARASRMPGTRSCCPRCGRGAVLRCLCTRLRGRQTALRRSRRLTLASQPQRGVARLRRGGRDDADAVGGPSVHGPRTVGTVNE